MTSSRIKRSRLLPSSLAATEAMAERNPAEPDQFEEFMRRGRNPSGTSVGCIRCGCGAEKGKTRWARVADGQPKGTRCFDCGNSRRWRREVGYTHRARVALETKKRSFNKVKGVLQNLRAAMCLGEHTALEFRTERLAEIDIIAVEIGELEQLPNWKNDTTETTSTEGAEELD